MVIDASALLDVLLRTPESEPVARRLFQSGQTLHVPHLLDIEVAQVVRRYAAAGKIDAARGSAVLADLMDFPLQRHRHDALLQRVWQLRHNLTAYDATYVALAEALDRPLLTRDSRLTRAGVHRARIALV